jgi:hypothetical protein
MLHITLEAKDDSIDKIPKAEGLPSNCIIRSTWFNVLVPGKMAFPFIISPRIHPILHISTGFVYLLDPRTISGALYHLVAIYSVFI